MDTYIPILNAPLPWPTIEYVRDHGVVVHTSEDRTVGTAEVKQNQIISYCAVTLNEDGTIKDFARKPINKYSRMTPVKD